MTHKISLLTAASESDIQPRIGGKALLPVETEWPQNPNSEPLVLVASLPSEFLNKELGYSLPGGTYVSVFTTYSKSDYFLDVITYTGSEAELANIRNGFTKVILHEAGKARNEADYLVPARLMELSPLPSDDGNYTGSKLGGEPSWLQQEVIDMPDYKYAMQLYSSDFPEEFEDIFYLTDAIGYLLVAPQSLAATEEIGIFFVQTT
jgi:hypothetical protein